MWQRPHGGSGSLTPSEPTAAAQTLKFQQLQTTPRTGWVRSGVQQPESVADHMYRMAVLAMTVAGGEYDHSKLVKMAIVHDLAEALVGDIAPSDNVPETEKHAREARALEEMLTALGANTAAAHEMRALWCDALWNNEIAANPACSGGRSTINAACTQLFDLEPE